MDIDAARAQLIAKNIAALRKAESDAIEYKKRVALFESDEYWDVEVPKVIAMTRQHLIDEGRTPTGEKFKTDPATIGEFNYAGLLIHFEYDGGPMHYNGFMGIETRDYKEAVASRICVESRVWCEFEGGGEFGHWDEED